MYIETSLTRRFGIQHPVVLAPMGDVAGGRLAAAVSRAGGLGLVGGGRGDPDWLRRELDIVRGCDRPWGVGLLAWSADRAAVDLALQAGASAVLLSFGDPGVLAPLVRDAGVPLIVQVTDLEEARRALAVGADVVVAQGAAAGGHGGGRSTITLVPAVVDLAGSTPVLAAGGIADGRGLAAALALGAAGVLVGTRFEATTEAILDGAAARAIVDADGDGTEQSRVTDIGRDSPWPSRYPARTLRSAFIDTWRGREDELRADAGARAAFQRAMAAGDLSASPVWAGEAVDLIAGVRPAAHVLADLVAGAEAALRGASAAIHGAGPAGGAGGDEVEADEGGDPACWAGLTCPECGAITTDGYHRPGCPAADPSQAPRP